MKKLLVLVLILGMASLANAALVWSYAGSTATQSGGTYVVNVGDTITLALSSNNATSAGINVDIITDNGAAGNFTGASVSGIFTLGIAGISVPDLDGMLAPDVSGQAIGDWAMVSAASGGSMAAINSTIFSVTYVVGAGAGTITINGLANTGSQGWEQNLDQVQLLTTTETLPVAQMVIPEPATIALLCLGGLLLRKKK